MTPRFFMSYILVNIFRILTNLFETLIPFFRKTSVIAVATLLAAFAKSDPLPASLLTLADEILLEHATPMAEVESNNDEMLLDQVPPGIPLGSLFTLSVV